jgi:hypothetical protein
MSYYINIPSYKRYDILNEQTLTTLNNWGVDKNKIFVFVADKKEYDLYNKTLNKSFFNKIIIGKLGIVEQRKFIENYYPKNTHLVFMDDDIKSIVSYSKEFKAYTLDKFIKTAFNICKKNNCYIWGVYPINNEYFIKDKPEYSLSLTFIIGVFYGIINRPNEKDLNITISKKYKGNIEDIERSIYYFKKDKVILRFNKITFNTTYYKKIGGLGTLEERNENRIKFLKEINKKYPDYGDIIKKKNTYDFRFNTNF